LKIPFRGYLTSSPVRKAPDFNASPDLSTLHQARVVQKVDYAIRRINHYPTDSVVYFVNNYPLDRDLSGG